MIDGQLPKKDRSPDWQSMLTEMERCVDSALADATAREQVQWTDPQLSKRGNEAEPGTLTDSHVQTHLDSLSEFVNQAEVCVDEVGKMLDERKTAILRWQEEAEALRQELEVLLGHSVR